jgi:hypothetical protein
MTNKILVFSLLITLHSTGILFGSFFSYKWISFNEKDVGLFGICDYFNKSHIMNLLNPSKHETVSFHGFSSKSKNLTQDSEKSSSGKPLVVFRSAVDFTSNLDDDDSNLEEADATNSMRSLNNALKLNSDDESAAYTDLLMFKKCYQFLWPTTEEAYKYISSL